VLSWSCLESMSAGAMLVASNTAPVREVVTDGVNGRLVDFFDIKGWSAALTDALANPDATAPLRAAARRTIIERYDLATVCLPQQINFVENSENL